MIKHVALLISAILCASPAWSAITLDNAASFGDGTAAANPQSSSVTIAADANLAIVCLAERDTNSSNFTASTASVTVGGVAATQLTAVQTSDNLIRSVLFYKLAPATGSVTVQATPDTGSDLMAVGVLTFKGVAQSGTFNTAATNSSTGSANADVDGLASSVGELAVLCGATRLSTTTASPDATTPVSTEQLDYVTTGGAIFVRMFSYTEDGASSSINMRVDLAGSDRWAAAAVSLRPLLTTAVRHRSTVLLP